MIEYVKDGQPGKYGIAGDTMRVQFIGTEAELVVVKTNLTVLSTGNTANITMTMGSIEVLPFGRGAMQVRISRGLLPEVVFDFTGEVMLHADSGIIPFKSSIKAEIISDAPPSMKKGK